MAKEIVKKKVTSKVKAVKAVAKKPAKAEKIEKSVIEKVAKTAKASKPVKKVNKNKNVDTGSVDYQIGNFTDKISSLTKHLKEHPHDFDSRRGLLIMVGKRRRLLNYVKKTDMEAYERVTKQLKLKA